MKKLNLLILAMSFLMVSGIFAQTTPIKQIQKPEDPAIRKIKTSNPARTPMYKKPTIEQIQEVLYKTPRGGIKVNANATKTGNNIINEKKTGNITGSNGCPGVSYNMDYSTTELDFVGGLVPNDGWLYPGVIMDVKSVLDGNYNVNVKPRQAINLSTDATVSSGNSYVNVIKPEEIAKLNNAVTILKRKPSLTDAADMAYTTKEIYSEEDLAVKVSGYYNNSLANIKAKAEMSFDKTNKSNYLLVDFSQTYFSIGSDIINTENAFIGNNDDTDFSNLVYIKSVKYGRRALLILESEFSHQEIKAAFSLKYDGIVNDAGVDASLKSSQIRSSTKAKVIIYGGNAQDAAKAVAVPISELEKGFKSFISNSFQGSGTGNAKPIGYSLRYLANDGNLCAIRTIYNYDKSLCTPPPIKVNNYKLKVTLTDIQNINGRDGGGDNPDDYAIQQYIVYNANKKDKKWITRDINTIPERKNGPVQVANMPNVLISGDASHQLHIREANEPINRNRNISNSLVFNITNQEFMDPIAKFKIYTWFKEYTNGKDKVLANNTSISVNIKEVLEILSGAKKLDENTPFYDTTIAKNIKFHNFGAGNMLLANIQKISGKLVLEGPIRIGNPGEKAAVWLQFELVD